MSFYFDQMLLKWVLTLVFPILLRLYVANGGYSGIKDPPHFGDFEAQRHWMELAVNLPPKQWYVESQFNDFSWWRLDYPPLSGYFAYVWGQIALQFDLPEIVEPFKSRGLESAQVKVFMRLSVLVSELLFLIPFLLALRDKSASNLLLSAPLLILIDHGHFQYNCVMLGLVLLGFLCLQKGRICLGSICFTLAFNFKIMALYYALGFFVYILRTLREESKGICGFLLGIAKVGLIVLLTQIALWWPWLDKDMSFLGVLAAIFPVQRGLYQLHVGTFWCISNVAIKWAALYSQPTLFKLSSGLTLLASLPLMIKIYKRKDFLKIGLIGISQAFFLFSFHVHEKTILLPLVFILISEKELKELVPLYSLIATITHHPLMIEDKLEMEYFTLLVLNLAYLILKYWGPKSGRVHQEVQPTHRKEAYLSEHPLAVLVIYTGYALLFCYFLIISAKPYVAPPERYPYLYELLIQLLGFVMYSLIYLLTLII